MLHTFTGDKNVAHKWQLQMPSNNNRIEGGGLMKFHLTKLIYFLPIYKQKVIYTGTVYTCAASAMSYVLFEMYPNFSGGTHLIRNSF